MSRERNSVHCFFIWESLILLMLLAVKESMTLGQLQAEDNETIVQSAQREIPGCRVVLRDDMVHVTVYCSKFNVNATPKLLPANTQRIQLYQVPDLPTDRPLFPQLVQLEELELPSNELENVTRQMFEGLSSLKTLDLRNNRIKLLFNDTFIHNMLLETIDLSGNYILSIGSIAGALGHLAFFTELKCANNMLIRWLAKSDFAPLKDIPLQKLDVSKSQIRIIEDDAFRYLENLSMLDLSANPFNETAVKNLSQNMNFTNLSELRLNKLIETFYFPLQLLRSLNNSKISLLDLSYNRFLGFPHGDFWFPELKYLDLTSCGISSIQDGSASAMPNLETLLLKRNRVEFVGREFYGFTNLKVLDLSNFETDVPSTEFTIADFAFSKLSKLEYLYLKSLPLRQTIRRNTLHGLVNLKELDISICVLSEIEDFAFESLGKLIKLDLSQNILGSLSNNTFFGLKNVQLITLSYNFISFLTTVHPFQHTQSLESLFLNKNKINFFPSGIFRNLPNIGLIFASENFIVPWNEQLLPRHKNMTVLKINDNAISYFTPQMLEDIQQLEFIDFSHNPLNCSMCGMEGLQTWMRNTSTAIKYLNYGPSDSSAYECHEPPALAKQPILDVIIPTKHCLPVRVDVLRLASSIVTPFIVFILVAFIVWRFFSWDIKYCYFHLRLKVKKYKEVIKAENYQYDAFVSYSQNDLLWVRHKLVPAIETGQPVLRMCIPDRDFDASDYVMNNVLAAIEQSRTTILVLSNSYMKSEWCKFELDMAQHKLFEETRNGLILILLEDIERSLVTKNLKYVMRTRTCIPWTQSTVGRKLFWERLRLAVAKPVDKVLLKHIT